MESLVCVRDNAMMASAGGGTSGGMGGGCMLREDPQTSSTHTSHQSKYASNMQSMFEGFMQMMGGVKPNVNPFANIQRDVSQRLLPRNFYLIFRGILYPYLTYLQGIFLPLGS